MSELRRLVAEAARFDDEALIAFASRGLLRRGQRLRDHAPTLHSESEGVIVAASDWTVTIGLGAPLTSAKCSCATAGVCQHIVATILTLRDEAPQSDTPQTDTPQSDTPQAEQPTPSPAISDMLAQLTDDALRRWCGTAQLRWALDRVASIDDGETRIHETNHVLVDLPTPLPSVRFMAPNLEAAIVDPAGRNDRRVVALAVLLMWRRSGRDVPILPQRATDTFDTADRRQVLATALALVEDALEQGLLHLSDAFVQRLDALAASARGARWYRIGQLAERSADELDGIERRDAAADPAVLLDLLAELGTVANHSRDLLDQGLMVSESLAGTARANYEPSGPLELIGCGHANWGDALFGGSIAVLAEVGTQRLVSLSVARTVRGTSRPANLSWSGAAGVEALAGARVHLTGARLSADLRLSNSASTTATTAPADLAALARSAWSGDEPPAASRLHGRRGYRWVVAELESASQAAFDPIAQSLIWPIRSAGTDVAVQLPYRPTTAGSIAALERLASAGPTHVIGGLRRVGSGLRMEPISLLIEGRLEVLAASSTAASSAARGESGAQTARPPIDPLGGVAARLVQLAERGSSRSQRADQETLGSYCSDRGLTVLADVLTSNDGETARLVRAAWVLGEYQRLERSDEVALA